VRTKLDYFACFLCLVVGTLAGPSLKGMVFGEKVVYIPVQPVIAAKSEAPAPAQPTAQQERDAAIVSAVQRFAYFKSELARYKQFDYPKNAEEAAGNVQFVFKMKESLDNLKADIERNQFSSLQIGYSKGQLNALRKDLYTETIRQIDILSRIGTTNRCIGEGGCFGSQAEIRQTRLGVKKLIAQINQT
jgi:hypothetical protein